MTCNDCIYYKKLSKHKEAWGVCMWWEHYPEPEKPNLPEWSIKITTQSGALSPSKKACSVFDGGE